MLFRNPMMKLLQDDFDSLFSTPQYKTDETGNTVVELEIPGFNKDNIDVEISDGLLTIRGKTDKREYFNQYTIGAIEDVKATIKDGILSLTFIEKQKQIKKVQLNQIEYDPDI